jgi:hypothetical protein
MQNNASKGHPITMKARCSYLLSPCTGRKHPSVSNWHCMRPLRRLLGSAPDGAAKTFWDGNVARSSRKTKIRPKFREIRCFGPYSVTLLLGNIYNMRKFTFTNNAQLREWCSTTVIWVPFLSGSYLIDVTHNSGSISQNTSDILEVKIAGSALN